MSIDAATVLLTAAARLEELASSAARCLLVAGSLQASNRQLLAGCRRDVVARKFLNLLLLLLTALLEGRAGAVSSDDLDARDAAVNLTSRATVLPELASGTSAVDLSVETLAGSAASSELVSRTAVVSLLASRTSTPRHITLVLEGLAGTAASRTAVLPGLTSGTAALSYSTLEGLAGASASSGRTVASEPTSRTLLLDEVVVEALAGAAADSDSALTGLLT